MRIILALSLVGLFSTSAYAQQAAEAAHKTETIASLDGIKISADLYAPHPITETPMVILFHQAESSRGEYREIAKILNSKTLNAIAIDLRAGNKMNGVANLTFASAKKAGKNTNYLDAYQDMVASLRHVDKTYKPRRIYVWGSSFSASLALRLTAEYPQLIRAVFAFSPGEYFRKKNYILRYAKRIRRPTFITSAKSEKSRWATLYNAISTSTKVSFVPKSKGYHGARALWPKSKGNQEYWAAIDSFLAQLASQ